MIIHAVCEKVGLVRFELTASSSRTRRAPPALQPDVAEVTGIEPAISGLTGRRDNQLRYTSEPEKQ